MEINNSLVNNYNQTNTVDRAKASDNDTKRQEIITEKKDQYILGKKEDGKVTYDKPKIDRATIQRLKSESNMTHSSLRRMVEELLRRQGMTFRDLEVGAELEVDEIARAEAQGLIGEGGDLSPEKVSDRIVEFAKAISGGDKEKFAELKSAIEEGFRQAAQVLGGELPEISQRTYDLVMEKLNQWLEEE